MSTKTKANRCFLRSLVFVLSVMFVWAASQDSWAVDPAKLRQQSQSKTEDPEARRFDDSSRPIDDTRLRGARDRDQDAGDRRADLNQEGAPAFHPPWPHPRRWMLGVRVQYLNTGARVTQAIPGTPAWRIGLEPRDVIVSIDGYQIGYVNRRFYEISSELNARAGRSGRVRLLVQNCRNSQLMNVDVGLAPVGAGFPRQRFDLPPGARSDQADKDGRQRDAASPDPKIQTPNDVE
jgi:C-terminal processing protease CtpA/Prc